ncbi:MAG: indole-3-glycerol phosphate synthase TrpC [Gemmatimonadales bacterium]
MKPTLSDILASTARRVALLRDRRPDLRQAAERSPVPRSFTGAFAGDSVAVIAEVKRRSPSAGEIRADLDPVTHARAYQAGGAAAISVLTDREYFGGSLADLEAVARAVGLPALRKDFILDELQLFEARAAGASAVLLIARALKPRRLAELARTAREIELGTLVEVHDERELDVALAAKPTAVGVNSRDLTDFTVDLGVAERLLGMVPSGVPAVAESGIETRSDVERMAGAGAAAVLVGTSVAGAPDPKAAVAALAGVARAAR